MMNQRNKIIPIVQEEKKLDKNDIQSEVSSSHSSSEESDSSEMTNEDDVSQNQNQNQDQDPKQRTSNMLTLNLNDQGSGGKKTKVELALSPSVLGSNKKCQDVQHVSILNSPRSENNSLLGMQLSNRNSQINLSMVGAKDQSDKQQTKEVIDLSKPNAGTAFQRNKRIR